MKKLLFIINSLGGGGAEKVLVDLLKMLDKTKYEIDLISTVGGVHEKELPKEVNYIKLTKKGGFWCKLLQKIPSGLFRWLFVKKKYDVEIAYLEGLPTKIVAKGKNTKKIAFIHCDVSVKPVLQRKYKTKEACIKEYKKFDSVCFVSKMAKEGFEKTFAKLENAKIVHNVVNTEETKTKASEKNDFEYQTTGLKIISVGRLSSEKGYERLIKICAELEKKYDFELCILGDGCEREKLEALIGELNIKSVRLLGFQKNPYSFMKKADLYVCPSFYEGYSTTVTECMILGIPVLTTDCAGMDEILHNGKYGIIVANEENELKKGLEFILNNPSMILSIKEKIKTYSFGKSLDEYYCLFDADNK